MAQSLTSWNQETFDRTLRTYLQRLPEEKIPNALNKKAFFVQLGALQESPRVNPFKLLFELKNVVTLKRDDGSTGEAPIGYALAAKRASKHEVARRAKLKRKTKFTIDRWRRLVGKKFEAMVAGRRASLSFIRAGWVASIQAMAPHVRGKDGRSYARGEVKLRGAAKGKATPAKPGWSPKVSIENSASAKSDKRLGLIKYGAPALQRAFDRETADMVAYLEREALKEETEKFNAAQR